MSLRVLGWKMLAVLGVLLGTTAVRGEEINYVALNDVNVASRVEALEAELASLRSNLGGGYDQSSDHGCGCYDRGWIAGAELLLLTPHAGSLQVLGDGLITARYGVNASPRFWLGYRNDQGLGVRGRYWTFDGDTGPAAFDLSRNLHMEAIDVEVTQLEYLGKWTFDLSFGLRWAQDRNMYYNVGPGGFSAAGLQDFQGAGGTIALGAWRPIGGRGFSLFLNTRASLLFGQNLYGASLVIPPVPDVSPGVALAGALKSEDEVVSVYEMQLGVEWSRQLDNGNRFYARLAAECQAWNIPSPALGLLDDTTGLFGAALAFGFNR